MKTMLDKSEEPNKKRQIDSSYDCAINQLECLTNQQNNDNWVIDDFFNENLSRREAIRREPLFSKTLVPISVN